jgi:hypothetical protein
MERLPAQITEEPKRLIQGLESQEDLLRDLLEDIRQTLREGNDLLTRVDETTKTVDSTASRIDSMIRAPASGRPFDIMDYQNTVLAASDEFKQANSLLDSMGRLLASPDYEQHKSMMVRLVEGVESEAEKVIRHAFVHGAGLILIFFLALFLTLVGYQYVSKRMRG